LDYVIVVVKLATIYFSTMEPSKSSLLQPLPSELLPMENFEAWLDNDGFISAYYTDENKRHYLQELHKVKANFRDGISNRSVLTTVEGEILNPIEIYNLIEGYRIRIQKIRLVIHPYYTLATHLHNITTNNGSKKVKYLLARAYWINSDGKKVRKFSRNLGPEEKVKVNGALPRDEWDNVEKELVQMSWEKYKAEYPLMVFEPNYTELEFKTLIDKIDLYKEEDYDCKSLNVWSYQKATDIRDGVSTKFGNMCNGFPFEFAGVNFHNSECAYIAGAYASNDEDSTRLQRLIAEESNGYLCKKIYRNNAKYTIYMRKDFYTYNVQWMLYVLWEKCCHNKEFQSLLKLIPIDAHVVENTTLQNGATATFWGAKNMELITARKSKMFEIERDYKFRFKKDLDQAQSVAANSINDIGHFKGTNVMGKIIKICSLCLIYGQEPQIDYGLLRSKDLYLFGKQIKF